jgi:crotonobetainyl-CoA:carnitine CoA-transferase CaiB-like acyl-CoA transferase
MKPLDGIKVLDFTHVLAGPVCTRMLTDLGADVLKVESHKRPDRPWTAAGPTTFGRSASFVMVHRGKQSIAIDLKHPDGAAIARRLAAAADVVTENFSAGVMERLGLGPEDLRSETPGLIYVRMSGYGNDGPRSGWTSMNSILQSHSGSMMASDREGAPPVALSNSWMDYMGGMHACFALLEALGRRHASGEGATIDLSQFECGVSTLGPHLVAGIANGVPPPRTGNRSPGAAPQGVYRCAGRDAWCAISVENDAQWTALVDAMGAPEWALAERYTSAVGRRRHHDELDERLSAWTTSYEAGELATRLRSASVAAEAMHTSADVLADASAQAVYRTVQFDGIVSLLSRPPFEFVPEALDEPGPPTPLGGNGATALHAWLGLDEAAIERIETAGALT